MSAKETGPLPFGSSYVRASEKPSWPLLSHICRIRWNDLGFEQCKTRSSPDQPLVTSIWGLRLLTRKAIAIDVDERAGMWTGQVARLAEIG